MICRVQQASTERPLFFGKRSAKSIASLINLVTACVWWNGLVSRLSSRIKLDQKYSYVAKKLLRDSLFTRGDNTLNPYKNRGCRWKWPVVVLPENKPPQGWKRTDVLVENHGTKPRFLTKDQGFGFYITYEEWQSSLEKIKKNDNIKKEVGRFKIGIPQEQAASEDDCELIALALAFQTHRILGRTIDEIKEFAPELWSAVQPFPLLQEPKCPFCFDQLTVDGFIEESEDTSDVFYKRKEAEDKVIQLFHVKPLRAEGFLHCPGNVSWGHRRCNVTLGSHSIPETLDWFAHVLKNRGWKIANFSA